MQNIPVHYYEGQTLNPAYNKAIPEGIDPYLPDDKLIKAVQLAQVLNRPLLLKGEPGCGKTRLAEAVAYELFSGRFNNKDRYRDYYFEWHVKSNGKAQEGLYVINHLQRLRDANMRNKKDSLDITLQDGAWKGAYIELGPLGKAFALTNTMDDGLPPPVVLIDEIDKADIDFPNDLLLELDKLEFEIAEVNDGGDPKKIKAKENKKPLIIITSNDEKPLPAAFLRRCLFHYINYPGPERLQLIVEARFPTLKEKGLAKPAAEKFHELRREIEKAGTASKNISTSELLDWTSIMNYNLEQQAVLPDFTGVENEQTLAKDWETMKIFMKYNDEKKEEKKKEKQPHAVEAADIG